jgi:hypothetical protein
MLVSGWRVVAAVSSISRWSYKNVATVKPFVSQDQMSGATTYGTPYEIACTWIAEAKQEREMGGQSGAGGAEFTSRHTIFTEDKRPKYLDLISFDGSDGDEQIRNVVNWDMSPFNEADSPDFKLIT